MFSSWGLLCYLQLLLLSELRERSVLGLQLILVPIAKKEVFSLAGNSSSCPMHKTCLGLFPIKVTEHFPRWNWAFSYFLTFSSLYQNFPQPPSFPSVFCQRGTIFQEGNWMKCSFNPSKVCKTCGEILHQFGPQPFVWCLVVVSISQDGGQAARSFKSPTFP